MIQILERLGFAQTGCDSWSRGQVSVIDEDGLFVAYAYDAEFDWTAYNKSDAEIETPRIETRSVLRNGLAGERRLQELLSRKVWNGSTTESTAT